MRGVRIFCRVYSLQFIVYSLQIEATSTFNGSSKAGAVYVSLLLRAPSVVPVGSGRGEAGDCTDSAHGGEDVRGVGGRRNRRQGIGFSGGVFGAA